MPTNTLLWGYGVSELSPSLSLSRRLIGPSGPVELEQRYLPVYSYGEQKTHIPLLVPATELEPNTRYQIELHDPAREREEAVVDRKSFVTASGAAEQAPALPELLSSAPEASEDTSRWRDLEFSQADILVGDSDRILGAVASVSELLLDAGRGTFRDLPDSPAARWLTRGPSLGVGVGGCMIWPDEGVETVQARFGAFDLAGNFSGWVDVPELALPTPEEVEVALEERRAEIAAMPPASVYAGPRHGDGHNMGCALHAPAKPGRGMGGFALLALVPLFVSAARRRLRR